ncbi:MAG: AraC family transcriptional regulator [Candidatus Pelagadaptatus aseana]|uniref:AraC family transcriptional regulator n=1 Tax=Candidatus Pelagadaptatus aseana TaxID=3120508 RepID=UPI0039B237CE
MSIDNTPLKKDRITTNPILFAHLITGVKDAGYDIEQIYTACDIDVKAMQNPDYRLPVTSAVKLLHQCGYLLQDEFLGMLESPIPLGYFRHSVLAVIHQNTLGQALQRYIEFNNTFFNSLSFQFKKKGRFVEVVMVRDPSKRIRDNVAIESAMATLHRTAGWLCNELIFLDKVTLDYPPPSYHKEYKHLFYGAPVQFDHKLNSMVFEARYLDLPIVQNETSAESYVRRAPLDIYLPQDVHGETSRLIREKLKSSVASRHFTQELQDIALDMGISSQTIRRRLAKEGTSFNAIKSQVRRDIAMNALGNRDASIEDVTIQAGYSEPAAFIRAFKSWTGVSPARFRKMINAPG